MIKETKGFRYLDEEDCERKIDGLPQLEKIHKFADEELQKFDSFALIALNHTEENFFEDDFGNLCNGTIVTKLGDEKRYEDDKDRLSKDVGREVTLSDYSVANLGALITHLVDSHFDSKKEKVAFYQTLEYQTNYRDTELNSEDIHFYAELEKRFDEIRELIAADYDISEGIVLLNSVITAIRRWQNLTDDDRKVLEKSRKEFDKRKK